MKRMRFSLMSLMMINGEKGLLSYIWRYCECINSLRSILKFLEISALIWSDDVYLEF